MFTQFSFIIFDPSSTVFIDNLVWGIADEFSDEYADGDDSGDDPLFFCVPAPVIASVIDPSPVAAPVIDPDPELNLSLYCVFRKFEWPTSV